MFNFHFVLQIQDSENQERDNTIFKKYPQKQLASGRKWNTVKKDKWKCRNEGKKIKFIGTNIN